MCEFWRERNRLLAFYLNDLQVLTLKQYFVKMQGRFTVAGDGYFVDVLCFTMFLLSRWLGSEILALKPRRWPRNCGAQLRKREAQPRR